MEILSEIGNERGNKENHKMRKRNTGGEQKLNERTVFYRRKKQRLGSLLSPFPYARRKNDVLSGIP